MKCGPKEQNGEVLDEVASEGSCLRNYDSVGLRRGWEDALISSIDKKIEIRRSALEARAARLSRESDGM